VGTYNQPTPEYLEAMTRRALAVFDRCGRGSPIRHMTALGTGEVHYYVREAIEDAHREGPWWDGRLYGYAAMLVHEALAAHLQHGVPVRDAVANVKRRSHWKQRG
jgi:hypothetical protein